LFATADRYFNICVSFLSVAAISRLLTPEEIGLAVIGSAICAMWFRLREFTTVTYIILRKDLTMEDIRAAFSTMLCLSALLGLFLMAGADILARLYQQEKLVPLIRINALAFFMEAFSAPILALLQRDMAFGKVAVINIANAVVIAGGSIIFAILGFGYLSSALGWLIGAICTSILAICLRPDLRVFRPLMKNWGGAIGFGAYNGLNVFLYGMFESLPLVLIGKLISVGAVANYSRSLTIVQIPDKLFLAGVAAVALPAFANQAWQGGNIKQAYLNAVSHITAVQWPALVLVTILAYPAVLLLFGKQWLEAVPLVRIIALGCCFSFSATLNYPVLLSLGGMREVLLRAIIAWPISALIVCCAALFGLTAVAFSFWIAMAFQALVSIYFLRRHVALGWREYAVSLSKSLTVTMTTAAGALLIIACGGFEFRLSLFEGVLAGLAGATGWFAGLWATEHPLLAEMINAIEASRRYWPVSKVWPASKVSSEVLE
jgi:O-antigen/teichoic acid export membrane protein